MSINNIPEYLNINQACAALGYDRNQLQHAIKKFNLRLSIYINHKKNPLSGYFGNGERYGIKEFKNNSISTDELIRISKLTDEQLKHEGFKFTPLDNENGFLIENGKHTVILSYEDGQKSLRLPTPITTEVANDGFVDLCEKSILNPKQSIDSIFRGDIIDVLFVKSRNQDFEHKLDTFFKASFGEIYLHQNELKKINPNLKNPLSTQSSIPQMLPHIRKSNLLKRADQVTDLYNKLCDDHPVRIDLEKAKEPIQLINLAWVLAFCYLKFDSYQNVKFTDISLNSMAESIRKMIIDHLQHSGNLSGLTAKYFDEVDFATETTVTKTLSYKITPKILIEKISTIPRLHDCFFSKSTSSDINHNPVDAVTKSKDIESVLKTRLAQSLKKNIKSINPSYTGKIADKTGAPQRLILKVMCAMIELDFSLAKITWGSVKDFIEEHIYGIAELVQLSKLEEIDDLQLVVDGDVALKPNCQDRVSRYKASLFSTQHKE